MSTNVKKGFWVNKTENRSKSLEIVSVDNHRKEVTTVDGQIMTFKNLTDKYILPNFGGEIEIAKPILGSLPKENDIIEEKLVDDIAENDNLLKIQVDSGHEERGHEELKKSTPFKKAKVQLTDDEKLIKSALTKSLGSSRIIPLGDDSDDESKFVFNFDIIKVAKTAEMFDVDDDKVADIILDSDVCAETLKSILLLVLKKALKQ